MFGSTHLGTDAPSKSCLLVSATCLESPGHNVRRQSVVGGFAAEPTESAGAGPKTVKLQVSEQTNATKQPPLCMSRIFPDNIANFPSSVSHLGMNHNEFTMEVVWTGPYAWPKYEVEASLPPVPRRHGLYIQTVEYCGGYLMCAVGLTRRPIPARLREHTPRFFSGDYTILDMEALRTAVRKEIWHGWGWTPEKRAEFERRKDEIGVAAHRQLAGYRMFVAEVDPRERTLERLEGAIWNLLHGLPKPLGDIADRGVMKAPRWKTEQPIMVKNRCEAPLHGLPADIEI